MKNIFRYAWPVICVFLFQLITFAATSPKSSLAGACMVYAFAVIDFALGWAQWFEYRSHLRLKADLAVLKPRIKGRCTCKTVWSAHFPCDLHGDPPEAV